VTSPPARERLRALADRLGILPSYYDIRGRSHPTSDASYERLAAAMGYDGSDEAAAARSLERLAREACAGLVDPVYVWRQWEGAPLLRVRAPAGAADYELLLQQEDGRRERTRGRLDAGEPGRALDLALPFKPSEGYHELGLTLSTPSGVESAVQSLILTPRTCMTPADLLGGSPRYGIWTNLYSVRSAHDDGHGDFGDLAHLLRWAGKAGADFVGVNPLHALRNQGLGVSPYSPLSRLYRNVLYLDLDTIPELAESAEARALLASAQFVRERAALRATPRVEHARVLAWKRSVLEILFRAFQALHQGRGTPRARAYDDYRTGEGEPLLDFATFCVLEESLAGDGGAHVPWPAWPAALRHPRSVEVSAFRAKHGDRVEFHAWIQFELDRQLALAAVAAREAGMALGVYQDLAIGLAPDAADLWAFPGLFARGASVGAPPDDYAPQGQDWGLPPLDPIRLRGDRYRYYVRLLRAAFAHAGALRIDHVMGLFRLFWIPVGGPSAAGAYVRYPADDLLGILALESRRHRALVVGEDLGTVPDEIPRGLESWGILSSRVLLFERDAGGAFRPGASYTPRAMVTANTHDLPTLPAFCDASDLELRRRLGLLPDDESLAVARAERHADRLALEERLRAEGLLATGMGEPDYAELRAAVDAFLCKTPAALAGLSLDDLAGEREPVNVPGVPLDRFPSWSRRMRQPLEQLASEPAIAEGMAQAARLRPR
jgi:4-alpha-glucanotransferase